MTRILILVPFCLVSLYAASVDFSGSASIYAEYDTIQGKPQGRPASTIRFNLNPTLTVYGIPISLSLYLSTAESQVRQALNKYRILVEPAKLAKNATNVFGFVRAISRIEVGTCYPDYSDLILSGIPVTGGAIEIDPWIFHLAATAGRTQRGVVGSDTTDAAYKRMIYAGRFGVGRKAGSHLFFTVLYAGDDSASIPPYTFTFGQIDTDTVAIITPMENYLAGAELKITLFQNHFSIESEIAGSQLTRDVRMPELNFQDIPQWVINLTHPRLCSQFDYAYLLGSTLEIFDTKIYGSVRMVGPGFSSLGAPNQRNDYFSYKLSISKSLVNNSVSTSASYSREHDNLIGGKVYTTFYNRYAFNLGLNFKNLPYVQVSYAPYSLHNDEVNARCDIVSLSIGHNFTVIGLSNSPSLSFYYQRYDNTVDFKDYKTTSFFFSENISFRFPFRLTTSAGITTSDYIDSHQRIISFDVNGSYTIFTGWQNTLGLTIALRDNKANKRDLYFKTALPIWKLGSMNLSIERNIFQGEHAEEDYQEWRLKGNLTRKW